MKQEIRDRWSGEIKFTAEIEANPTMPLGVRIGLAVKWAIKTGADLTGANLTRADLTRADLTRADLTGAKVHGEEIKRLIASASRSDGYVFYAFEMMAGGVKIMAGCRWFTPKEYRIHIRTEYPATDKGVETGRILDLIEGRMADLGIVTKEIA
jgi:hypothetical protein